MLKVTYVQRWKFYVTGLGWAIVITLGLVLVRGWAACDMSWHGMLGDVATQSVMYGYVICATFGVGLGLGWLVGRYTERLEWMSLTDSLTQLANRRCVDMALEVEALRAQRYHLPLSLLLMDLDHFKWVNDVQGHKAGDALLQWVAQGLEGTCRRTDLAARVGGDEFVVLAPCTTAQEAYAWVARLRLQLKNVPGCWDSQEPALSVSVGIADVAGVGTYQIEALWAAADTALYQAKAAGRNRTRLASQGPCRSMCSWGGYEKDQHDLWKGDLDRFKRRTAVA